MNYECRHRKGVPLWIFVPVLLIALGACALLALPAQFPFPDWGHRTFGVRSEYAARVVTRILAKDGLGESITFDVGPTRQTLLKDGRTVIFQDKDGALGNLSKNAISLPVSDPEKSAHAATLELGKHLFGATARPVEGPGLKPGSLWVVESNAFENWVLVYRLHLLKMGRPKADTLF